MSERDPRVDPRPGDVVVSQRQVRGVLASDDVGVVLLATGYLEHMTRDAWQNWARGGEVITRGEP